MIAMALACEPELLIADEPTTAGRDRAAQDPAAAQILAATLGHVAAADQPRPQPGAQHRAAGVRDAGG
jgi:energy-coupling factor transporter ATP-binding protein EcfA2